MKRKLLFAFNSAFTAVFAALFLSGCIFINITEFLSVSPKGEKENYAIVTGGFSGIIIEGACNINYYSAPSGTVTLSIHPNLREYYSIEVIDNDLIIKAAKSINFGPKNIPDLTVSVPVLNRVAVKGACDFTAHDKITADSLIISIMGTGSGKAELDTENLFANISGAGKLDLSGKTGYAELVLSGTGELNAISLQAHDAGVNLSGTGTIRVNSGSNLRVNASGTGTVVYRGSPSLELNQNGLVTVRREE